MRCPRSFTTDRCYHLVSRIAHRSFFLDEVEKTRKRESPPLLGAGKKLGCEKLTLVTDHERETVQSGAQVVEVVPTWDWLR